MPKSLGERKNEKMRDVSYLLEATAQIMREGREQARLSQADLAEKVGCVRSFVSFIETETHLPGLNAFVALAQAMDVSPSELMRRIEIRIQQLKDRKNIPNKKFRMRK